MRLFIFTLISSYTIAQVNVTLRSQVTLNDFSLQPSSGNDIWGITDAVGREYVIMGASNGTAVFDISNPDLPIEVGMISGNSSTWRDVKSFTYDNTPGQFSAFAFVTTEASGSGMQVIDLSNLPASISLAATYTGGGLSKAHNIYVDPNGSQPFVYILGANIGGGGVVVLDVSDPLVPTQTGIWDDFYVHDFYLGNHWADPSFDGQDIGIAFCGSDNFSIINFDDKSNPQTLDGYTYPNLNYCHSGWVSEDGRYLFVCDELDEQNASIPTTIRVFDLIDMTQPQLVQTWTGPTNAIDHNAFIKDTFLHLSNYTRGYTILDIADPVNPVEYGYYDTYPPNDNASFSGAWGVYPYFQSGLVAVSDINSGLYVFEPSLAAGFSLTSNPAEFAACIDNDSNTVAVQSVSVLGFTEPISLSVTGLPSGATAQFSSNPINPGDSTQLTLSLDASVIAGDYAITLTGVASGAPDRQILLSLTVFDSPDDAPSNLTPADMSSCTGSQSVSLSWQSQGPQRLYHVVVADNEAMLNPVFEQTVATNNVDLPALVTDQWFYWHVQTDNPCGSSAATPVQSFFTSKPVVLLVDDDDNTPDVRPYYASLLQSMGLPYAVYDVNGTSANGPNLAMMQDYQWIIWFSGDQYGGTSSPQAGPTDLDESNLTTYLQQGGYLFMTCQDYLYDQGGVTTFMSSQLGVATADSDGGDYDSVVGIGNFASYGQLSLDPTVGSEYFDTLEPGSGALAFDGLNGNNAAVETSRSLMLGFPFETVIQNQPIVAMQIMLDLMDSYQIGCSEVSNPCLVFDLDQNGLNMQDLLAHAAQWPVNAIDSPLIQVVNCIDP